MSVSEKPIEVRNLVKYYAYGVRGILVKVLDGVSFSLENNEVLGLVGANGAGKSTTIKILVGAVKPSAGECLIFGKPLDKRGRARLGYLPETPYFYKFLTGFELVRFYARLSGLSSDASKTAAMKTLDLVGLGDAADRQVGLYSKGMLQRAGLAQAIVHNPDLVILDEPVSGLDPVGAADMAEIVRRLKAGGKSVLMCSHSTGDVEALCDRVVMLSRGTIAACGPLDELLTVRGRTQMVFDTAEKTKLDGISAAAQKLGVAEISRGRERISLSDFFRLTIKK